MQETAGTIGQLLVQHLPGDGHGGLLVPPDGGDGVVLLAEDPHGAALEDVHGGQLKVRPVAGELAAGVTEMIFFKFECFHHTLTIEKNLDCHHENIFLKC